jgi:ABC-type multidrug transport system fused ATPase/permease subunit
MPSTNQETLTYALLKFWKVLDVRRKRQFFFLLLLMVSASLAEIVSIGAIFPLLTVLSNPDKTPDSSLLSLVLSINDTNPSKQFLLVTVIFCIVTILANMVRVLLLWATAKFSFGVGSDLGTMIYNNVLKQPYIVHLNSNSSEIINTITLKMQQSIGILLNILNIISSGLIAVSICITLLYIDFIVAVSVFFFLGLIYVMLSRVMHKRLLVNSHNISDRSTDIIQTLQEGLSGIRDVLISNLQGLYCSQYRKADLPLKQAQAENSFIGASPRFLVEGLSLIIMAIAAYFLSSSSQDINSAIPVLGTLALGAQRLIPLVQNIYLGWVNIRGSQASLIEVITILDLPLPKYELDNVPVKPLSFQKHITMNNICFQYASGQANILNDVTFKIEKGARVGFVGTTGSGKSTLLDVIMGLLVPSSGELLVDDIVVDFSDVRGWHMHIAHVPQSIYLTDTTIAENIAFGTPIDQIDLARVIAAAKLAQVAETIDSFQDGYQTRVGERGVKLSGGQRQRIGIARALYKKANVIIFDEATSALDEKTELDLIAAIRSLSKELTILTVAHRTSTIAECSTVYRVENGRVTRER